MILRILIYKKIMSYHQDGCLSGCKEADGRGRRQEARDLSTWFGMGSGRSDFGTAKGWSDFGTAKRAEATRVSSRRDVVNESLGTKSVSRPPNSANKTLKIVLSPTKSNVHSPLKTDLNTNRKYAERQQDIHQPQRSVS